MTNNIDIVEQLREEGFITHIGGLSRESKLLHEAADEIERLRKERDEVRLELCKRVSKTIWNPQFPLMSEKQYAEERGWDCFKESFNE